METASSAARQLPGPGGPPRRQNLLKRRSKLPISWLVWTILTAIAVAVISSMVLILVLVFLLQPHSPFVTVQGAQLDTIRYNNDVGTLAVRMPLLLEADNVRNLHSTATFTEMEVRVSFGESTLALVRGPEQLHLAARGAQQLPFVASAQGATLGHLGRDTIRSAVRDNVVPFQLNGQARVSWKFSVVTIKQWTRFTCAISFSGSDGKPLPFNCSSKNKNKFF